MTVKAEAVPYIDAYRAQPRPADEPRWLAERREAALRNFGDKGFPTRRQEAWRFTDLRPLQRAPLPPASGGAVAPHALDAYRLTGAVHRLVFVNGRFSPELSVIDAMPKGVWLAPMARTLAERPNIVADAIDETDTVGAQPFASLNAALFTDGFVLSLEPGVSLEDPIEIIHLGRAEAPCSLHLRNLVALGAGSRASLIESYAGEGAYWTNAVTTVKIGENADFFSVKLQDEGAGAIHFAVTRVRLAAASRYDSFTLTLGARLSRHETLAALDGEGAQLDLNGAYLLRRAQEATNATFVDHAAPGGMTRELFKGVVEERAHGVFLGSISVRPEAQKTDARQLNKNLLLSPRATVDTKPELEILADDVKCSHGATVGDLDEGALFYLRARGISEVEARRMLIEAFAADAIDTVENAALRGHLARHLARWLAHSGV